MRGFEVAPDSPISMHNVHVDMEQFLEASPLKHTYCEQISEKDFEQQATNATSEALAVSIWNGGLFCQGVVNKLVMSCIGIYYDRLNLYIWHDFNFEI